jgi:ABC-type antimicrobial peptide transport system permease subunit
LKGTFRAGRVAVLQRKFLVVLQFTVSVILIISTLVVFQQIQFAKDRQIGYHPGNLITISETPEIHHHFGAFRSELKKSGAVTEVAESANPTTDYYVSDGRFNWPGKDPALSIDFPISNVSPEYGKTIGWNIIEGRDFSNHFASDSSAFILNEAAVKFMGFKDPVGKTVEWNGKPFRVIGVIRDIVFESPYRPVQPYIYEMTGDQSYVINLKLNACRGIKQSLIEIGKVFESYNPELPFAYKFTDQEFSTKFGDEERVGRLAAFFTILAIFISCLGIFGLATFTARQRIKEIGIRKVLGSSVFGLFLLLSKDFVRLVIISLLIASPLAYYFMHNWLQNFQYRTPLSWWLFAWAGLGALGITLITVSYQSINAALTNPVNSLRSE